MGKCKICLSTGKSKTFDRISLYQHVSSQLDPILRMVKDFRYRPSGPTGGSYLQNYLYELLQIFPRAKKRSKSSCKELICQSYNVIYH